MHALRALIRNASAPWLSLGLVCATRQSMLTGRMLQPYTPPARSDGRSTEAVFDVAAARFGRDREPAAVRALVASGVECAQQLAELSDRDWEMVGVSLGLKTAIKVELGHPSAPAFEPFGKHDDDALDQKLRQFLLLPSADGKEAQPLGSADAMFVCLLTTPAHERQRLLLMVCELIALVSGLFLEIPLSFSHRRELAVDKGWEVPPSLADGMDALGMLVFWCDAWVAMVATAMALFIATSGWMANDHHCYGAISVLAHLFIYVFMQCMVYPLLMLAFWHAFTDATSPYPLIGCLVLCMVLYVYLGHTVFTLMIENTPLECYHLPRWVRVSMGFLMPWFRGRLSDKVLRARAEVRAAQLRAQMGMGYTGRVRASSHDA